MLRYKEFVIPTISLFFKSKNDVDVFIEDSNDEEFYKVLLQRLTSGKRIKKIISCKCKTELLKACESDQFDRKRKRIYLTDGDLDLILDTNRKDLKRRLKIRIHVTPASHRRRRETIDPCSFFAADRPH